MLYNHIQICIKHLIRRKISTMKTKRIVTLLLAAVMVLALAACNVQGSNYSDKNAYVSIYVYGDGGKTLLSNEAIRVAPIDESELSDETTEGGLLTEEAARQRYRVKPTGMYALELSVRAKDKNAALPVVVVSQFNGEIEYTLDTVLNSVAGKKTGSNDIYEWVCKINDEVADPFERELKTYDKVVFALLEKTERNFTAAFEINNGEVTITPEKKFTVFGEKSELTISKFLTSDYLDEDKGTPVKPVNSDLDITLSEDGKRVVKIGSLESDDTHRWVCYIGDEEEAEYITDLTDVMINERLTISFDYREIQVEDTSTGEAENTEEEPA